MLYSTVTIAAIAAKLAASGPLVTRGYDTYDMATGTSLAKSVNEMLDVVEKASKGMAGKDAQTLEWAYICPMTGELSDTLDDAEDFIQEGLKRDKMGDDTAKAIQAVVDRVDKFVKSMQGTNSRCNKFTNLKEKARKLNSLLNYRSRHHKRDGSTDGGTDNDGYTTGDSGRQVIDLGRNTAARQQRVQRQRIKRDTDSDKDFNSGKTDGSDGLTGADTDNGGYTTDESGQVIAEEGRKEALERVWDTRQRNAKRGTDPDTDSSTSDDGNTTDEDGHQRRKPNNSRNKGGPAVYRSLANGLADTVKQLTKVVDAHHDDKGINQRKYDDEFTCEFADKLTKSIQRLSRQSGADDDAKKKVQSAVDDFSKSANDKRVYCSNKIDRLSRAAKVL